MAAHHLKLVGEAVHVIHVVVFALGVLRVLIVAAAAGEVAGLGVIGAGERAVAHAVAIHVQVTGEPAQPVQIFRRENLAAVDGLLRYENGSDIQLFIPRSRSVMMKTGVWNRSAKSKASIVIEKHSSMEQGKNMGCLVSPCERSAVVSRSPCLVRVGRPVDGPTRSTSKITAGTSA